MTQLFTTTCSRVSGGNLIEFFTEGQNLHAYILAKVEDFSFAYDKIIALN